jgi:hypothetical protein
MPVNSFTVGKDLTFTLVGPNGNITLSGVTDYTTKPMFKDLEHDGIDGGTEFAAIPRGWEISIKLDRQDNTLDVLFAALEAAYFAGTNITGGTISENITEVSGSVTKFQYTGVSYTLEDAGNYKGDSFVPQSLRAKCSRRTQLS